jgi:pantothenate kinase
MIEAGRRQNVLTTRSQIFRVAMQSGGFLCTRRWRSGSASNKQDTAVRIAIEGNIASGKSTLLELIRTEFKVFTGL